MDDKRNICVICGKNSAYDENGICDDCILDGDNEWITDCEIIAKQQETKGEKKDE